MVFVVCCVLPDSVVGLAARGCLAPEPQGIAWMRVEFKILSSVDVPSPKYLYSFSFTLSVSLRYSVFGSFSVVGRRCTCV